MPKAAAAEKTVTKAQFLKSLDKRKAAARTAAKAKRPEGFMSDEAILAKLGIHSKSDSVTVTAAVSKIVLYYAKGDSNRPAFRFALVVTSDDGKGTVLPKNVIIEDSKKTDGEVFRTEEQNIEDLFFTFQGLGEDTEAWLTHPSGNPLHCAVEAAEKHTAEKTELSVYVSAYERSAGGLGMNLRIDPLSSVAGDNSDLEEDSEEEDDSEEEYDSEEGEFNPEEWMDGWVSFKNEEYGNDDGLVFMKVSSYDADTDSFSGTDTSGAIWDGEFAPTRDDVDWVEDQAQFE